MDLRKIIAENLTKIQNVQLPLALKKIHTTYLLLALLISAMSVVAVLIMKNIGFLIGLIIAMFFVVLMIKLKYDYSSGKIMEFKMICTSASVNNIKKEIDIIMQDEDGANHRFICMGTNHRFFKGVEYIIYINKEDEQVIKAYQEI